MDCYVILLYLLYTVSGGCTTILVRRGSSWDICDMFATFGVELCTTVFHRWLAGSEVEQP